MPKAQSTADNITIARRGSSSRPGEAGSRPRLPAAGQGEELQPSRRSPTSTGRPQWMRTVRVTAVTRARGPPDPHSHSPAWWPGTARGPRCGAPLPTRSSRRATPAGTPELAAPQFESQAWRFRTLIGQGEGT